ncbi:MAG TPA: hypothetical protein VGQ48_01565 [Gemmatimonadales bacterium]|jgi:hypothetical protein|nr:hypothetical protein [Gemmatimonadales bacterium]
MLSLLLITALAVQYPQPASKPASQDTTAPKRTATATPRTGTQGAAVGRMAFHDRMRDLWSDQIVYTRSFIVSATAGLADTTEVLQRLLRNQDEMGEAIKPYYGDAAGSQLASLLRNHIQLAGKALVAAKGTCTAMHTGMNMDASGQYVSSQYGNQTRMGDTVSVTLRTDSAQVKASSQYPTATGRMNDTTKANRAANAKQPNARVTGDTMSARLPSNQYGTVRTGDTTQQNVTPQGNVSAQGQMQGQAQVDSVALKQAIADLKANGDSIAMFLSTANPRGFARTTMQGAIQMHLNLLLQEVTAHLKKDWAGSVAAFDESQRQAAQMADMLSEGIMKQFPSRFSNKATTVSSR